MTFPAPVPEIPAANVDKAAAYYVDTLGFTIDLWDDQGGIAGISRGELQTVYHQSLLPGILRQHRRYPFLAQSGQQG
jgi:hypothetical protein